MNDKKKKLICARDPTMIKKKMHVKGRKSGFPFTCIFFLLKHLKCAMLIGNTGVIFGNRLHDYDNFTFGKNLYTFSNTMDIENGMPI